MTFLSVGFWLLDVPHQIVKCIKKCNHDRKNKYRIRKRKYVDDYAYDLGYHMSYGLTTLAIALMFGFLVPLVMVFALFFFCFKYYVDKYNLSFVYSAEFQGRGMFKDKTIFYVTFITVLMQFITLGFFASKPANSHGATVYFKFGLTFVILETFVLIGSWFYNKQRRIQ